MPWLEFELCLNCWVSALNQHIITHLCIDIQPHERITCAHTLLVPLNNNLHSPALCLILALPYTLFSLFNHGIILLTFKSPFQPQKWYIGLIYREVSPLRFDFSHSNEKFTCIFLSVTRFLMNSFLMISNELFTQKI